MMLRRFPLVSVFVAWGLTVLWILLVFAFPDSWQDSHGNNAIVALGAVSFGFLGLGIVLWIAANFRMVNWSFAVTTALTPVGHVIGAALEAPWCFVAFALPSVFVLPASFLQLRTSIRDSRGQSEPERDRD